MAVTSRCCVAVRGGSLSPVSRRKGSTGGTHRPDERTIVFETGAARGGAPGTKTAPVKGRRIGPAVDDAGEPGQATPRVRRCSRQLIGRSARSIRVVVVSPAG